MARILIADDAAPVRFVVKEILEQAGHQVVAEASSGQQAVHQFARELPDVSLIDVQMPVMNGARAARAIRDLAPEAALILTSGVEQTELRRHAQELDAFFITKPFLAEELLLLVADATRR